MKTSPATTPPETAGARATAAHRSSPRRVVVVGNGMVGHELVRRLVAADVGHRIVVFGDEPRPAYDRVRLSSYVATRDVTALALAEPEVYEHPDVQLRSASRVVAIDRDRQVVRTDQGADEAYDELVLATGSRPFVPPVGDGDGPGCHVYRTIEDLDDLVASVASGARRGVVIGGGLLGLEAAEALRTLGLHTTVVEFAPHLMPAQLDAPAAAALRRHVEALGIEVRTEHATKRVVRAADGRPRALEFADGTTLDTDVVVYSAGIRPRDELARDCGLPVGERGGVLVDRTCRTEDPHVWAVGEVAAVDGVTHGLVGPGYAQARVVAARLAGGDGEVPDADLSTKLKLLGVDVASFGDAKATTPAARCVVVDDPVAAVHQKLVVDDDGRLLGGILVGDADAYAVLHQFHLGGEPLPAAPITLLQPAAGDAAPALGPAALPDSCTVCTCSNVTKGEVRAATAGGRITTLAQLKAATNVGTGCGSCATLCQRLMEHELEAAGIEVDRSLCEHFPHTRQELFDIVRTRRVRTFAELLDGWGTGSGCATCKPAVASMLATLWNEHVLDAAHAPLQDTNDRYLANLQRDGTYSVVPRVPAGEITPRQLIVLGEVATEFDLYTKITGGQRVDLFGARLDQLPSIWQRLIDAGFESGHAYGKALRTVKSCVGTAWCRYGVQDSTALAVQLELRYRGLRSPHKLKSAVSGCSRECAEAQSKDFGVIATEKGWNLYVCGNGGMRPRHADLLAEDLDTPTLVRVLDRFLMFYVRTADKLERTSTWFERREGGMEELRAILLDDSLGICDELEAAMADHVASYTDEWAATLADPQKVARFRHFVNDDTPDPDLAYVRERGQRRPVFDHERELLPVLATSGTGRSDGQVGG
ncbi:nitrite reductase large subunit NirB [Egicoccus halophilus]|uniref:assimilatory sulfite reductase (ferredoxin) n=1 Tax=Egicoccus halophilus TaxID=1670830 RepID=A0A8J3AA53_9ACTN|nr:nitrite reductase large subunit NirB [Egicoccus halophilus]GGI08458.1 nitrite reductase large subunit [Egicoccus halophilus]